MTPALLALLLLPTQDDPARDLSPELRRHQGTWRVVSFVHDGQEADPEVMASIRRTVEGARVIWSRDGKRFSATGLELDPGATPPALDLIPEGGPRRGERVLGIYRLEGDRLTICVADPGTPRPDTFSAATGGRRTLMILERETAASIDRDGREAENDIDLSRFDPEAPVTP